mgnify:FL=1
MISVAEFVVVSARILMADLQGFVVLSDPGNVALVSIKCVSSTSKFR